MDRKFTTEQLHAIGFYDIDWWDDEHYEDETTGICDIILLDDRWAVTIWDDSLPDLTFNREWTILGPINDRYIYRLTNNKSNDIIMAYSSQTNKIISGSPTDKELLIWMNIKKTRDLLGLWTRD